MDYSEEIYVPGQPTTEGSVAYRKLIPVNRRESSALSSLATASLESWSFCPHLLGIGIKTCTTTPRLWGTEY